MSFGALEDKIEEARNEQSSSNQTEYEKLPSLKLSPHAVLSGELVAVGFTGDTSAEQNIRGGDWGDEGDFAFTLRDPSVMHGQAWEAIGRDETESGLIRDLEPDYYPFTVDRNSGKATRDFRVVDPEGEYTSSLYKEVSGDPEQVGIETSVGPSSTPYPATPVDTASDGEGEFDLPLGDFDEIEIFQGSQAGRIMMQAVDVTFGASAYIRHANDGTEEKSPGLIEYPHGYGQNDYSPDEDGYPRVARQPVVHPELQGEEVLIALRAEELEGDYGSYTKNFGHVFLRDADSIENTTQLDQGAPEEEGASEVFETAPEAIDAQYSYLTWHEPESGWGSSDSSSDGDESASGGTDDFFDDLEQGSEDGYNDLDTDSQQFVDEAAEWAVNEKDAASAARAFGDPEPAIEKAQREGEVSDDVTVTTIEDAIDERIDQIA